MGKIIGIDLGTTNSAVAIFDEITGKSQILENRATTKRTTPSVIALTLANKKNPNRVWAVGDEARNQSAVNPIETFYGVKRLIGRKFNDPEVKKMMALASYQIVEDPRATPGEGDAWVMVDGKAMAPAEISAKVLMQLKKQAEEILGEEVTEAVITVPAYFNDEQRKATQAAGAIAGLKVDRIINEPTAAALAYGMDKTENAKIAVFDLGGGTFDVSILKITHMDGENLIEVISNNGDTFLGGENFDEAITEHLLSILNDEADLGINLKDPESKKKHATTIQKVRLAAEKAKIALSQVDTIMINEPFIAFDANNSPINLECPLTRKDLEDILRPLVLATLEPCKKALADAGMTAKDLDKVILVGGQTKMPLVIETVKNFFGLEPSREVNPDEIVAMGASVQGAIMSGKVDNVLLRDVIPLSIGIRAFGDVLNIQVPRNTPLPFSNKQDASTLGKRVFTTAHDLQENVEVQVYQGERAVASANKLLGTFTLEVPPMPKGGPQVRIDMEIDENGVLTVSAVELTTKREIKAVIETSSGLTDAEIKRMQDDAAKNAEADEKFRQLNNIIAQVEMDLKKAAAEKDKEYFQSASDELKAEFTKAFDELTQVRTSNNLEQLTEKKEALSKVRMAIGEAFAKKAGGAEASSNDNAAEGAEPSAPATGTDGPSM